MAPTSSSGTADPSATTTTSTATTGAQAEASADPVQATVEGGWAKYDTDGKEGLTRAEFDKWLTELRTAAGQEKPTKAYLNSAFRKADTDKKKTISKDELVAFLKG